MSRTRSVSLSLLLALLTWLVQTPADAFDLAQSVPTYNYDARVAVGASGGGPWSRSSPRMRCGAGSRPGRPTATAASAGEPLAVICTRV
jgi:hypothetical protein